MTAKSYPFLDKVMDLLLDTVCVVDAEGRFVFVSAACEELFGYTQDELIGRNMIELVYPEDRERTLAAARKIMREQPQTHFENRYVRKDGRIVHIMWSARWSEADGVRLAVARDVTELKRAAHMQAALYQISEAAHAADGLSALYGHIHRIISELLPAGKLVVALYDETDDTLSFPYGADDQESGRGAQPLVTGTPIAEVIRTGRPLLITAGSPDKPAAMESARHHDTADWLGVPLITQNGIVGALALQSYSGSVRYSDADKELVQFVSTQVATTIERKRAETRLHHMARHDALTDLPNRTLFYDRFDTALKRAYRDGERLALLYLDVDQFKVVNDTFGHDAGDQLLCEVARRLVECVRESDTVGRMGGDEFTVLLTNIRGSECVELVTEKIHAAISVPFEFDGRALAISVSIGTAVYPEHGEGREQLLRHADVSMYTGKL